MQNFMTKYLKNNIVLFAFLLCLFTSCVSSDINFASDMIEEGYKMRTYIDTLNLFSTYQCKVDSFPANSTGTGYIGRWESDSTGSVVASMATTYAPVGFEENTFFGEGAKMDSMKLTVVFADNRQWGDSTIGMKINVYRINGIALNKDSIYFTNFPIEKYIDPTPICTFNTLRNISSGSISVKLPLWYADLHLDNRADTSNIYMRDDKFINRINGMYFTAEPINPSDRRLLKIDLSSSSMRVFYHNDHSGDSLLYQQFFFYNTSASEFPVDIQLTRRDYTKAKPEMGGVDYRVIGDTLEKQSRTFISSPSGLCTRIDIDTSYITNVKRTAKSLGYNNVAILNANLRVKPVYTDWKSLDKMFSTLKLYNDINELYFLNEYNPILSAMSSSSSNSYNTVGGALVRTLGYYSFDITGYIQRLFTGATTWNHLDIYPAYTSGLEWGETYIGGSEDPEFHPELIITYSFIQQK